MKNLMDLLGIKIIAVNKTNAIISLEVTDSIKQPYGVVHGGINAVLAETAASLGANENVSANSHAVGIDISTQHLAAVSSGVLTATAVPVHTGRKIQTWHIEIKNNDRLTSTSTVTLLVEK